MNRVIGTVNGSEKGALVLVLGAVHGNEIAGYDAIREVLDLLNHALHDSALSKFHGKFIGLIGNRAALSAGKRFVDCDMNRLWTREHIAMLQQPSNTQFNAEEVELLDLYKFILHEIQDYKPEALIVLDLHTTSAEGGVFCIPAHTQQSLRLAKHLHAPVILGLLDGIEGTLLHFIQDKQFHVNGYPEHQIGVAFEGGQHDEPASKSRCIAAIFNCLRSAGCIPEDAFLGKHDQILTDHSASLPKVTELVYVHHIQPADAFKMRPGYFNFKSIAQNEHLADDKNGPIHASSAGRILMPLYQTQGTDGFFIVKDLESEN
ncbi:MAG: succinylglutamate desuccinylase/aspartoacylase family protein [Saprospiraceae bacterium]